MSKTYQEIKKLGDEIWNLDQKLHHTKDKKQYKKYMDRLCQISSDLELVDLIGIDAYISEHYTQ